MKIKEDIFKGGLEVNIFKRNTWQQTKILWVLKVDMEVVDLKMIESAQFRYVEQIITRGEITKTCIKSSNE